jgi:hypothetical protein
VCARLARGGVRPWPHGWVPACRWQRCATAHACSVLCVPWSGRGCRWNAFRSGVCHTKMHRNILCASLLRTLVLTRVLARDLVLTPTFRNPHDSSYLPDSATLAEFSSRSSTLQQLLQRHPDGLWPHSRRTQTRLALALGSDGLRCFRGGRGRGRGGSPDSSRRGRGESSRCER